MGNLNFEESFTFINLHNVRTRAQGRFILVKNKRGNKYVRLSKEITDEVLGAGCNALKVAVDKYTNEVRLVFTTNADGIPAVLRKGERTIVFFNLMLVKFLLSHFGCGTEEELMLTASKNISVNNDFATYIIKRQ